MAKKKSKKAAKKKVAKKSSARKAAKKNTRKAARKPAKQARRPAAKKPAPRPEPKVTTINPYLTFAGNCEEAFHFYRSVFGGEFGYIGRFKDMPPSPDHGSAPETEGNRIMHISLPISKETTLMGSDSSDAFGHATVTGNNFSISVNAVSDREADRIFNGLSNGGKITMALSHTFWGSYFGMCVDKYGIQWMVSAEPEKK